MTDYPDLKPYYEFWDGFVKDWITNCESPGQHLPEPWWGWTPENGDLYSVTLNLSPGAGGKSQSRCCVRCAMICGGCDNSYRKAMFNGTLRTHLELSERWHYNRRCKPLMDFIDSKPMPKDTRHHLSIELAPYHSQDAELNRAYLKKRAKDAVINSLHFAARAAQMIKSPKGEQVPNPLRNKVIVRAKIGNVLSFAEEDIDYTPGNNFLLEKITVSSFKLKEKGLDDVTFICLSGARNNLPFSDKLEQILKKIN